MKPILYIVIPCYNEEKVLPLTSGLFRGKLTSLSKAGLISEDSRILFVNDGSRDSTWKIICSLSASDRRFSGISLSRNRGHQNALLAGLMESRKYCDIAISIDCDGQDDIDAMDDMVREYLSGSDIVYGVRSSRESDSFFKRTTARGFYRFMRLLGAEVVYDHADYRLLSKHVLDELAGYREVNIFLRGMIPLIGFRSSCVAYERKKRAAGKSHYPLVKMLSLALDGITSLSTKPLRLITGLGIAVALLSFAGIIWSFVRYFSGRTVTGWASMTCIICFLCGVQLLCLGIIGEYVGKLYLEVKSRPRYIIAERTGSVNEKKISAEESTAISHIH